MRFWDASAVVPLLVVEPGSDRARALGRADSDMVVWWGTEVECASALARMEREDTLSARDVDGCFDSLAHLSRAWLEIEPSDAVRETARRVLRVHALRAADALQLAAAHVACGHRPDTLEFVTLDGRLAAAARKEGFVALE